MYDDLNYTQWPMDVETYYKHFPNKFIDYKKSIYTPKMPEDKKYDTGVIVARYHVDNLTDGHLAVLKRALSECHKVIIFLGVTPVLDSMRNPLDFQTRELMVRNAINGNNIIVSSITDQPSDESWSKMLDAKIREFAPFGTVQLYGGRDSFFPHYLGKYKKNTTEVDTVVKVSGTKNREAIRALPRPTADFRAGVIYGKGNRYPKVFPTVDIGVWRRVTGDTETHIQVLLGRKPREKLFRLPGGFVDPTDADYQAAALRELFEETGIYPDGVAQPVYLGSMNVDDWRYRSEVDKIITTLFAVEYIVAQKPVAGDDLAEVKWFDIEDLDFTKVERVHVPLVNKLLDKHPWLK